MFISVTITWEGCQASRFAYLVSIGFGLIVESLSSLDRLSLAFSEGFLCDDKVINVKVKVLQENNYPLVCLFSK